MVGLKLTIKGNVQGVGFRWFAKQVALSLGLQGTAMNLEGGDVEIFCQGNVYKLSLFTDAMRKGPADAKVDSIDIKKVEEKEMEGFQVIR